MSGVATVGKQATSSPRNGGDKDDGIAVLEGVVPAGVGVVDDDHHAFAGEGECVPGAEFFVERGGRGGGGGYLFGF